MDEPERDPPPRDMDDRLELPRCDAERDALELRDPEKASLRDREPYCDDEFRRALSRDALLSSPPWRNVPELPPACAWRARSWACMLLRAGESMPRPSIDCRAWFRAWERCASSPRKLLRLPASPSCLPCCWRLALSR